MSGSSPPALRRQRGLWIQAGLLALLPVLTVRSVADPSPWLHLRVGSFLRDGGRFGLPDPWAPFAAHRYVPTQWLPSVVVAQGYDAFGIAAVVWARGVAIVALAVAVLWLTRTVSRTVVAVPVTLATVAAAWVSPSVRSSQDSCCSSSRSAPGGAPGATTAPGGGSSPSPGWPPAPMACGSWDWSSVAWSSWDWD